LLTMLILLFSPFRKKRIKRPGEIKKQNHFTGQAIRLGRRKDKKMSHAELAKAQRVLSHFACIVASVSSASLW
jgi:hypothetical protein